MFQELTDFLDKIDKGNVGEWVAIRADRFCEGALLGFMKCGTIQIWLRRLKEIDD